VTNEDDTDYRPAKFLDDDDRALSKSIDRLWETLDSQKLVSLKSQSQEDDINDFLYVTKCCNSEQLEYIVRAGYNKFNEEFISAAEQEIFDRSVLEAAEIVTVVPDEKEEDEEQE
jgi:hypothetical protein